MSQVSAEMERLNTVMRSKVEDLNESDAKLRQTFNQNELLMKRVREL
jgi:hypothetical protein